MKRGTPEHPKVVKLAELLNIEKFGAVGLLELLWHFTAKFAPQGDIGKYSDKVIAEALGFHKRPGLTRVPAEFLPSSRLVTTELWLSSSLVRAEFVDSCHCHRLVVHDWSDHADEAVRKFLSRHGLDFVHTVAACQSQSHCQSQSQQPPDRTETGSSTGRKPPAAAAAAAAAACPPASQPENENENAPPNGQTGDWLWDLVDQATGGGKDLPPPYLTNQYGRRERNPQMARISRVIEDARDRVRNSRKPVAYVKSLIRSELKGGSG